MWFAKANEGEHEGAHLRVCFRKVLRDLSKVRELCERKGQKAAEVVFCANARRINEIDLEKGCSFGRDFWKKYYFDWDF